MPAICQRILSIPGRTCDRLERTGVEREEDADDEEDQRDTYSIRATESPANHDLPLKKPGKPEVHRHRSRRSSDLGAFLENSPSSVAPSGATYQPSEEDESSKASDTESSEASEGSKSDESDTNNDVSTADNDGQSTSDSDNSSKVSRRQVPMKANHDLRTSRKAKTARFQIYVPRISPVEAEDGHLVRSKQTTRYLRGEGSVDVAIGADSDKGPNPDEDEEPFEGFSDGPNSDVVHAEEVKNAYQRNRALSGDDAHKKEATNYAAATARKALPSSVLPGLAAHSNGVLRRQSPLTKLTTKTTRNDTTRNELEACGNDVVLSVESGGRRALPHRQVLYQNHKPEEHSSGLAGSRDMITGIVRGAEATKSLKSWRSSVSPRHQTTRPPMKKRRRENEPDHEGEQYVGQDNATSKPSSPILRISPHPARPSSKRQKGDSNATPTGGAQLAESKNPLLSPNDPLLPDFDAFLPHRGKQTKFKRRTNIEIAASHLGTPRDSDGEPTPCSVTAKRRRAKAAGPHQARQEEQEDAVTTRRSGQDLVTAQMDNAAATPTSVPLRRATPLPGQDGTILGGLGTENYPVWLDTPRKPSAPAAVRVKSESPSPSSDRLRAIDAACSDGLAQSVKHNAENRSTRLEAGSRKGIATSHTQRTSVRNDVDDQGRHQSQITRDAARHPYSQTALARSQRLSLLNVHYHNRVNPPRPRDAASLIQRPPRDSFVANVRLGREKQKVLVVPRDPDRSPMPPPKRGQMRAAPGYED